MTLLLSVKHVRKYYGPEPVLTGVSFEIRAGEKIGLVGPNGSGKSTLMKILAGAEESDGGAMERSAGVRVGYLDQQPRFAPGRTVWDEALGALEFIRRSVRELEQLAEQIALVTNESEHRRLGVRFERLQHEVQLHDAYHLDRRIEQVLLGLGFDAASHRQPVDHLSGGQQNRLLLARLASLDANVLILDEPTNHLDLWARGALEVALREFDGTVIFVSHDRYFLNRVADHLLVVEPGRFRVIDGNYETYVHLVKEGLAADHRTGSIESSAPSKVRSSVNSKAVTNSDKPAKRKRKFSYRKAPTSKRRFTTAKRGSTNYMLR